jgi:hypothetical protein
VSAQDERGAAGTRRSWFLRHPRTTICALVLAFALAADLALGAFLIAPDPGTFRRLHPYYHHGFLANVSTTTRWGEREYAMHTNSLGFRDAGPREVALEPAGRRILFLGDSSVEGMGVTWEESFLGLLAQRLPGVELLNAAAVSYCPMVYRLKTQYLLEQVGLRFSELVVFIDISDIQDEVLYQSFEPHLPGPLERAGAATRAWLGERSFSFDALERIARRRRGGVSTALDTQKLEGAALADNTIYFRDLEAYQGGATQAEIEMGRWEWTIAEPLMEAWGKQGLDLAHADMTALAELCKARGIHLTVVVYPSPVQILMQDLESLQVTFWRAFASERALGFVNLFPNFVGPAAGRPRAVWEKFFIAGDVHWNPAGHARVADELVKHL